MFGRNNPLDDERGEDFKRQRSEDNAIRAFNPNIRNGHSWLNQTRKCAFKFSVILQDGLNHSYVPKIANTQG